MQTAGKIYNIGSVTKAKFIYNAYHFDKQTIYNIEHIEHAEFLFKSADFQELEQKINNTKDLQIASSQMLKTSYLRKTIAGSGTAKRAFDY